MKLEDILPTIKNKDQYRLYSLMKAAKDKIDEIKQDLDFKRQILSDLYRKDEHHQDTINHIYSSERVRLGVEPGTYGLKKQDMSVTARKRMKQVNKERLPVINKINELEGEVERLESELDDLDDEYTTYKNQLRDLQQHGTKKKQAQFWRDAYRHEEPF